MTQTSTAPDHRPVSAAARAPHVRLAKEGDMPALGEFLAAPGIRYLAGSAGAGHPTPFNAVVAIDDAGEIVAAAWVATVSPGEHQLYAAIQPAYHRTDVPVELAKAVFAVARGLGHDSLRATLQRDLCAPLDHFRAGGVRIESSFTTGGTTDVRLVLV